ncbi:restriction endonuclease-like protein [Acidimicrobium ferrooxidans DSM 10331]|uniref:Restriction endonuclease-like protein n=1 Tax=Acidimicrobium ferrooxidans (strain DSM 10331 / JCM 15462 / NBRC 103882 / ICP) TaxID=525909 RepID=C7LZT4_ACIFD|nr:HNH endonuclease signature motif containing protein [Acidimicrobium ferrooxidans]ACU54242.1 restriction endonuclease-like protein [Acidimicrobium ferrooxidans DSM 10331]
MPLVDGPLPVTVAVVASRATAMGEAMDLWVANTDRRWFDFLRQAGLEEVNFWSPSPSPPSSAIAVGTPWIFRLKKPDYALAGFGYFARFEQLSARLAWDRFGQGNGFASFEEFLDQVVRLRRLLRTSYPDRDTKIGCTTLVGACFLEEDRWLAPVPGFEPNVVRGKGYYVNSSEGDAISEWLAQQQAAAALPESVAALPVAGYREALTRVRLGQYGFQALVRSAYGGRCAITGESTAIALEAAHIVPFALEQRHDVRNGLLLRADFHRLFDAGLIGVDPSEWTVRVSPAIADPDENGQLYPTYQGQLAFPPPG